MTKLKKIIAYTALILTISCGSKASYDTFGKSLSPKGSIAMKAFLNKVNSDTSSYKVKGVVKEVCQAKGCWMTLKTEEGKSVRVTFKDYGFFVPKDISGKEVIIEGEAASVVLSKDMAEHYADDAGKEYADTDRNEISFVANGVLVSLD